jgi:nicotinamidase/pyrazinamidase
MELRDDIFDESTALLVIDMLNDFVRPEGALRVEGAQDVVPAIQRWIARARAAGSAVVYLTDAHRPDDAEFRAWPPHAVAGSPGAAVIDELAPRPEDLVIPKRRYSAFFGTGLEVTLREHGIRRLVFTGVLTDICVYHTAVDAFMGAYDVVVAEDACAAATPEDHAFALRQMQRLLQARLVRLGEAELARAA